MSSQNEIEKLTNIMTNFCMDKNIYELKELATYVYNAGYGNTKPLKAKITRLRAKNENIRQHCSSHDTCRVVIEQAKKDTAREIFSRIVEELTGSIENIKECYGVAEADGIEIAIYKVERFAKEYGIDLTEKEGEK